MRFLFSSSLFFKYSIDQNYILKYCQLFLQCKATIKSVSLSFLVQKFFSSSKLPPEYYAMFLRNVLSRNTIMKLKLKPATLLKKIGSKSILFISFIFLNLKNNYF